MERRQRWLEVQFRRHDESLTKIAKQLQILQDFISLNFDSFRSYALERERLDRNTHFTYETLLDRPPPHEVSSQHSSYRGSPMVHSQPPQSSHQTRLTPDQFASSRHLGHGSNPDGSAGSSDSDYDDDTMNPAQESDALPPLSNPCQISSHGNVVVDLSTERQEAGVHPLIQTGGYQEPNSTMAEYTGPTAAYYGIRRCDQDQRQGLQVPDSVLLDEEGPTDLSTERKEHNMTTSSVSNSPPYKVGAEGSILGGILTSYMPPRTKAETKEEVEPSQCYTQFARSRDASTDSTSKEYTAQSLWSAGTMSSAVMGASIISGSTGRSGSACSTDDISEHQSILHSPLGLDDRYCNKSDRSLAYQTCTADTNNDPPPRKPTGRSSKTHARPSNRGEYKSRRVSHESAESSTIVSSGATHRRSPTTSSTTSGGGGGDQSTSTTTATSSGRKNGNSNASKQCRYCGKTFQWLHSVKTHERLHTGIKPYGCKICGARFTQNGNLKVHAKTCVEKHAESYRARNVLICTVCTEMFSDTDALMEHQKSHDRMQWTIKEKTCQLCGEVFQKRSFLLEHEKVHVQDRSFLSSLGIQAEQQRSSNSNNQTATTTTPNVSTSKT